MIGEVDIRAEETGIKKLLHPVLDFLKRDWARILVGIVTFAI